jgi:hypothetical protein
VDPDPDPDPLQNVMDPEHCFKVIAFCKFTQVLLASACLVTFLARITLAKPSSPSSSIQQVKIGHCRVLIPCPFLFLQGCIRPIGNIRGSRFQ